MLNPPNRRIRTRMYGGVGGEEPRGSPLSRLTAASTTAASTASGLRSPYPTDKPSKGVRERPSKNELTLTGDDRISFGGWALVEHLASSLLGPARWVGRPFLQ